MQETLQEFWLPLALAATFGAFTGSLFRLTRRSGYQRPLLFPVMGLLAGIIAYFIHQLLVAGLNAPAWLLPIIVVLQVWLWLGPLGPKFKPHKSP